MAISFLAVLVCGIGCMEAGPEPAAKPDLPGRNLVAHWDANEGAGDVLHDRSGNGNHGTIHDATWVKMGKGHALAFSGTSSYVDFGNNAKLKITGDFSFSAWIKLTANPYLDPTTNWHIFGWEDYKKSGAVFRVGGDNARLYFRSSQADGSIEQGNSNAALSNQTFYHVVIVKKSGTVTFFVDGKQDTEFPCKDPTPNELPFNLSWSSQSFSGIMDNVRLYDCAVSAGGVVALYKEAAAEYGKDVSWIGELKLTPFVYYDTEQAIVEADFRGILPLREGERIGVELREKGKPPVAVRSPTHAPESGKTDFVFDLRKLTPGAYEACVSIRAGDKARAEAMVRFDYPAAPPTPPPPAQSTAAPLSAPAKTPSYAIEVNNGGGFAVRLGNESYPIESAFTYPYGGENRLTASDRPASSGEKDWKIQTEKIGDSAYRVVASGTYYKITREITAQASRILVKDRIENLTDADLGLAVDNRMGAKGSADVTFEALAAPVPPIFLRAKDHGLGLVPLNDVYQLLQKTYIEGRLGGSKIAGLGIPKGGSHTLEWAVYPIGTTDYYDLINAIRRDEGLNGLTVDGCLSISHSGQWLRQPPPDELVRFGGLKYMSSGCVTHVADDPGISFEGIEFVRYPKERKALRKNYAEIKKRFPDLKMGFHVAYNLYATRQTETTFPDSRLIGPSGKHEMYGNFEGYFSAEHRAQGWAWYPYYPTLTNSFGKELLNSVDVMMDEIGADMVWADGLLTGYGPASGNYPTSFAGTGEPWDGHSVDLDPATKMISRKFGQIVALGKDALLEYIRTINAKGGRVWINHMNAIPRTFAQQKVYWAAETNDGDQRCASLHLSPAPHGLAHPDKHATAQMIYDDVRSKLSWGALYTYYWYGGASQLTHRMITAEMHPITIEEIHSGCIKGRERLITTHSGVYGWPLDKDLHMASLWDGRGHSVPSGFLTTADHSGVRTKITLKQNETAILKKIPITLRSNKPVNLIAVQYDSAGVELSLNGRDNAELRLRHGDFLIQPGATYLVKADTERRIIADDKGVLTVPCSLNGLMRVSVKRQL